MEKIRQKTASLLIKTIEKIISANVNSCCMYVMYQAKLPEGAKKFKRK